ncbi:olfactory receptor 1496-like [Hyla sarda]|uniref:olfactory receptor 1496-like n=1 Tax=Hyla sarda TaxID=327740 RepID=UPI0024C2DC3C|nr:olfactory receptor 1496-like [Hyla sarda]
MTQLLPLPGKEHTPIPAALSERAEQKAWMDAIVEELRDQRRQEFHNKELPYEVRQAQQRDTKHLENMYIRNIPDLESHPWSGEGRVGKRATVTRDGCHTPEYAASQGATESTTDVPQPTPAVVEVWPAQLATAVPTPVVQAASSQMVVTISPTISDSNLSKPVRNLLLDQNPVDSSDDSRDISRGFFYLVPCLHLVDKYRQIYIQENNRTEVTEFLLLGFQIRKDKRIFLYCLLLVIYCLTICGNLLIITLVSTSKNLHTPMYFFISQLSISDILVSTDIVPNLLHILLNNGGTMTFIGCMTQLYFFSTSEGFECFLLAVMSYDRYVAICNPLRYSSIMTSGHCVILTVISWVFAFSGTLIYSITIAKLRFCGPNVIDNLFCDLVPLLELSCSDTFIVHLELYIISIPDVFIPTTIIVISYTYIVSAILRISSNTGRQKAFSTCSSHLIVVSIFYGTLFSVYIVPMKGQTLTMSKILSLLYTVFTPLVNPLIYSLRNKDIKKAVQETLTIVLYSVHLLATLPCRELNLDNLFFEVFL